jgi:glycosyltransferase involved in cell wall biosynthesis
LSNDYSVISDLNKVSIAQYYSELEDSKILFSPFGWGEICPKDFEAVMKGCLLVKPSVEHLNTGLSFHVPYETYVPVAWDLSDLKEKIQYYLSHSEEREKIVATAAARYEEYFANTTFLELIRSILKKICKSSSSVGGQGHLDTPFL